VNRLTYLTKDLMEISRLETGELKSNMQEMFLRDVVLDVVENLQYKAEDENIELVVHDFDKNIQIRADRNQIKQVLINLVENAIKYNKENGKVEIGMKEIGSGKIELFVKDTGIGIDTNDIERVTERFFRVDKSRSRERGGTGLGLSIVKHIIEAHGEKLTIESKPDEGSVFRFTLTPVSHVSV
jgi:two-component system phosphate regulon sensor histidine kinase PhoR